MLFDKRCQEGAKECVELSREYMEFARAVSLTVLNDQVLVNFGEDNFHSINKRIYEESMRNHQFALSNNGIYGFAKYHVYTMLHEKNLVKPFINFAKKKGYSCVYTN